MNTLTPQAVGAGLVRTAGSSRMVFDVAIDEFEATGDTSSLDTALAALEDATVCVQLARVYADLHRAELDRGDR